MKTKLLNRLSVKLIIAISALLVIILTIHTIITISNSEEYLTETRLQSADNIADLIKKSTRYGMLLNQRDNVHQIINRIGTEKGVLGIRVYNKLGEIIYSTDSSEIFTKVDMDAEACYGCHSQTKPLKELSSNNKMRIFQGKNSRVLGLINPIKNEKDCYTADCHAHSEDTDILGVLDVRLSLSSLDERIDGLTASTITNAIIITVLIALASGLFIIYMVNRPLNKIAKGIDEIGKGNLNYRMKINTNDEFGLIGSRFNQMTAKLDAAYKEIKDWSENLNKKVQEKSEELKNIYNQVIQIEKLASLGKLSATVAHELNNPLEGILTYSKLISKKLKNGKQEDNNGKILTFLELISDESARCGKIVKDLLIFSHKGDEEFGKEDIKQVVDKSISLINHHLELSNISLKKDYPEEEIFLPCNSQKIQQAFMALLINAIEAMPNGGTINISITKEDNSVEIKIKDEGSGINEKDLSHIFEPFYSTKEKSKGTGLGLSVVYGIINQHNGTINVEETSSEGTTFAITLPLTEKKVEYNYE